MICAWDSIAACALFMAFIVAMHAIETIGRKK